MFGEVFDTMITKYLTHDTCVWFMDNFWSMEVCEGIPRQWLRAWLLGLRKLLECLEEWLEEQKKEDFGMSWILGVFGIFGERMRDF